MYKSQRLALLAALVCPLCWASPALAEDAACISVVPEDIPAGEYILSVGVVDEETTQPVVQLGIKGRDEDGWYPLSKAKVTR
jgi:hypothetical protein